MTRRLTAVPSRARASFRAAVITVLTAALAIPQLALPTVAGAAEGDPISAKVVFQTTAGTIPSGYVRDTGAGYSAAAGSGWVTQASLANATHDPLTVTNNARSRNCTPASSYPANQQGLMHMQAPNNGSTSTSNITTPVAWEYALPSGRYQVSVGVGDANIGADAEAHVIHVEGVTAFSGLRKPASGTGCSTAGIRTATVWADVTDGKLTVDAIGGSNTKINFVTIDTVRITGFAAVAGPDSIALQWDDLAGATGYDIFRATTPEKVYNGTALASNVSVSEYTDATAVPGQIYWYAVTPTGTKIGQAGYAMIDSAVATHPALPLKVNFQDAVSTAPAGWVADSGQNYTNARGYGWVHAGTQVPVDLVGNGRLRTTTPDAGPTLMTTLHMQGNTVTSFVNSTATPPNKPYEGAWQLAVANGSYDVEVAVGDATVGSDITNHVINLEGTKVIDFPISGTPTGAGRFKTATATVPVSDGFLTVDPIGGTNTKIDYITVTPTPADQPPAKPSGLTATAGAGSVALGWTANVEDDIAGYNVFRGTTSTVATTGTPLNGDDPVAGTSYTDTTANNGTTYYYVIVAIDDADQKSPASAAVSATPQPTEPTLVPLPLKINFSIAAGPAVAGYTKDTGAPFTNFAGRGWVEPGTSNPRDLSDNARYRDPYNGETAASALQRGLVHMESSDISATFTGTKTSGSYEVAVPDGYYDVTVSAGDQDGAATATCLAPCYDSVHTIKVEGRTAIDAFQATATKEFSEKTVTKVHVTDGRLTIASGGVDSTNTKINYLEIVESDITAPAAPANLEATAGDGKVELSWGEVGASDLDGYRVYRSTDADVALTEANRLTDEPITETAFTDSTAANDTEYHYVVTAIDKNDNESDASETVSATPKDTTAPAVPADLHALAGDASVALSWNAGGSDADFDHYNVYRSTTSGVTAGTGTWIGSSETASFLDNGTAEAPLVNGTTYYYAVAAVDVKGNVSALSAEKSAEPTETPDTEAPAGPTGLVATAGDAKVTLNWDDNTESDVAGYRVYRSATAGGARTLLTTVTTSEYVDATALNGTAYYYVVTAVDYTGNQSAESNESSATPADTTAPAAPTGVAALGGVQKVTLSWTANTEPDIDRYRIYRFTTAAPQIDAAHLIAILTTNTGTTFVDTGRTAGTRYYYAIVAVDAVGNLSDASASVDAVAQDTPDTTAPAAPTGLAADVSDGQVHLTWTAVTAGDLAGYTVYRSTSAGGAKVKVSSAPISGTSFVDTAAPAGATAYYVVTASDSSSNESGYSNQVTAEIPSTGLDVKFSFTTAAGSVPTGYTKETGAAFDATRGYGWVTQASLSSSTHVGLDLTGNTRLRTRAVTDLQNRLIHMQYGDIVPTPTTNGNLTAGAWEYSVPNGRYTVSASVGDQPGAAKTGCDAPCYDSKHTVRAEGVTVINAFQATAAVEYQTGSATVDVTDGRLTVDAIGGNNTKLNWVSIVSAGPIAPDTTAPAAPASLLALPGDTTATLSWAAPADTDVVGYNVYRSVGGTVEVDATSKVNASLVTGTSFSDSGLTNGTTYRYVLTAVDSSANESAASASATVTPATGAGAAVNLKVNFADAATAPPAGYVTDYGQAFGQRSSVNQGTGNIYGWVKIGTSTPVSIEGNGRNRNTATPSANQADPRLATLVHMQLPASVTTGVHEDASWELAVPNGFYTVTVGVGDAGTAVDSSYWINIENQNAIAAFVPTTTGKFAAATRTVRVTDGRITLSPASGTNTKIDYVDVASVDATNRVPVIDMHPANLATNVVDNISPTADISPFQTLGAVDASSLGNGNVTLTKVATGANVPGSGVTSGGSDTITFQANEPLEGGVLYRLSITDGVTDIGGRHFLPFSTVFTTASGSGTGGDLSGVAFDKSDSGAAAGKSYTSLVIGPDGKLYAGSIYGYIYRWTINADGTLANQETISTVRTHASAKSWEGAPNRTVIGLSFDPASTAENPILWITDNYAYLGSDVPDMTGAIARLTGPNLENYQEVVVNLPRSIKDHETNSIAFKDGKLLIVQGSMNAMGRLEGTWRREEHLLSAAMLQLDPAKLPATLPVDAGTPDMDIPARGGVAAHTGTYNPYAADAPLTLYATGIRNAFDLLVHSNGRVYAGTNGSAAGGNTPASPSPLPAQCANRPDAPATSPAVPAITNNGQAETDYLFDVHQGKYYGHPNPLRCQYVLNAGNPTNYTGNPLFKVNAYPAGQLADPNYDIEHVHDAGLHASANGTIEYKNTVAFGGALAGKVIVVRYSANQEIVAFNVTNAGGVSDAIAGITGFTGFKQPLDIAQDVTTGNLYVSELTDNPATTGIKLLKPQGGGSAPKAEASSRLVFTEIAGGAASAAKNVSVKNIGGLPLTISAASITGTDAALFTRGGTLPITVAPGATVTIPVTFNPTVTGPRKANLVLTTNDPTAPTTTVALRGLGTIGTGGSNEPSLQWILDTLDIPVNVGDPDPSNNAMPESDALLGDEVDMPSFTKLLFDRKVGITPLSLFGPAGPTGNTNVAIVAAHKSAAPEDAASRVVLFNGPNGSNQTVLPDVTMVGEWDFDDAFGFDVTWPGLSNRVTWSEDAKNTWATNKHKIRVYPLKDSTGAVVTGSYIVAPEDVPTGVDYQDAVFIVSNVKAPATAGAGKLTTTPKELVFSGQRGSTSATQQVTLSNTGSTALVIGDLSLTGTNAASFALTGTPTLPLTLGVGDTAVVGVQFRPGASSTVGYQEAALKIVSDDSATPSLSYGLYGLATTGEQGNNEPTLKSVVDTLGYPINVGGTGLTLGTGADPIGDEVRAPLFTKAGTAPVTMTPIARYSPDELLPFGWYLPNAGDPVTNELASIALDNEQTLNPKIVAGGSNSFDPGAAPFGFYVHAESFGRFTYTQDGLNVGGPTARVQHAVRAYPVKNRAGASIPNTYLVGFEDASNGDYQDYVFLVTGVTPLTGTSTGTPVARIDFQPAASTVATGYTADTGAAYTAARGYGWIVPGTSTPLDMTAQTRDRSGSADAKLRTLILMQPTATQSASGPGAWQYTVPNGTYVVTVGVGDPDFTDSTHRVQVEGQTVINGFTPTTANPFSTATVTVTVSDGALTIDAAGGTNTKLTYVDIDRAATGADATAPVVNTTVTGLQSAAGVYKNTATITVTASDVGTGVAGVSYSLDNGAFAPYTAPVEVTATGAHTVRARAQDAAGNVTTTAVTTFSVVTAGASRASISVENADGVPFADRLVMNRIQSPQTGTTCRDAAACDPVTGPFFPANIVHDTGTLVIRNTGTEALNVTDLAVDGPFSLVSPPALPALVPVNGSLDLKVRFTATTGGANGGLWSGTLTVTSDDVAHPSVPVELAGFWQSVSEGGQEPDVAELAKLFGYTTAITAAGVAVNQKGTVEATGDEVLSPYWVRADASAPAAVRQLAAFHTQGNTASFFWHAKGSNATTTLFTHQGAEGQSVLPHKNNPTTATASATFTPTGAFGLKVDGEWSDPTRNGQDVDVTNGCSVPCGHHVRAWVVRDRSGAVVPNTYLVGMDYSGINYDYNDNLYLVSNIRPETAADPSAAALIPGAAGLQLPFSAAVAGTLADAAGAGTGFTSTQPNKLDRTVASNSYVASKLHLDAAAGTLVVDSSANGTNDVNGTNGSTDNSLQNGLQAAFDGSAGTYSVTARTLGAVNELNAGSEQRGIMLGADQDNYVKVVAINKTGVPSIEFYSEIGGTGATNGTSVAIPSPASVTSVDLALLADASAGTVKAAYKLSGGAWVVLPTTYTVPASALGRIFGTRTYGGIITSHKGGTAFTSTYDSFGITAGDVTETSAPRNALYRLDVAGSANYTDSQGQVWTPDTGRFSPATAVVEGASTTQEIAGTDDDVLYRTYRGNVGNVAQAQRVLSYDLPAKGATKVDLRLHFAERASGNNAAGKRLFDIAVEGTKVRSNFDIYSAAGGLNTATVLPINNVTVVGGRLELTLSATVDYPSIAAIEVLCQGTCPAADSTAPAAPTGLAGSAGSTGVELDWADSPATDLMGYNVYRSTSENGTYTRIASLVSGSYYTDTTAGSSQAFYRVTAVDSSENESDRSAAVAVTPPLPPTIRINTGGPAQTVGTTTWSGCSAIGTATTACSGWVSGGNTYSEADTITGIPAGMNNTIFQTEWTGGGSTAVGAKIFGFAVPVNNGYYRVRLHFAELNKTAAGARLFDVQLEGATVLSNFDIWLQAGGIDKAIVREFSTRITDGTVNIDFLKRVENAKISAIEIVPTDGPDTTAPAAVTGVGATASTSGVTVAWTASTATDLAGYNVYRAGSATGTYTKVNTAPLTGTSFGDTGAVQGVASYYQVTAVDNSGNESVRSATVNATRPDTTAPSAVTGVSATGSATGVALAWSASTASDLAGYNVYRATSATGSFTKLTGTLLTGTSFSDTTIAAGATGYYQVTAVDTAGNESVRSATVNATRSGGTRPTIRINAGGPAQTAGSATWSACSSLTACSGWVSGGNAYSETDTITGLPAGTNNALFQSEWTGGQATGVAVGARAFLFTVPVSNGYYRVRLHFAELNKTAANARLFDVRVENTTVLSNFDVWSAAGGIDKAIVKEFTANVADGNVSIDFITRKENAKVSAIEIIPADGPDTTAPATVTGVSATGSTSAVALSWTANTAADLSGYNVYRASSAAGSYTKLNATVVTGTSYSDTSIAAGATGYYQVTAVDNAGNESARSTPVSGGRTRPTIRINTGGPAITVSGTTWSACTSLTACGGWVSGGFVHAESDTITGVPAGMNNTLFQTEWTGGQSQPTPVAVGARAFGFAIPVSNGAYRVRLHFTELNKTAANARLFDVRLENSTVLSNFDIWSQAGGIDRAIVREFPVTISDGVVTLDFITRKENAKISAIEVIPSTGTDTVAPATMSGLTVQATPSAITLSAASSTAADVQGYNVYRAASAAATPVKLNAKPLPRATYTDKAPAPGVTAYYQMTAVDRSGNESKRSARVAAAKPATIRINAGGVTQKVGSYTWVACISTKVCSKAVMSGGAKRSEADRISRMAAGTNTSLYRSEWTGGSKAKAGKRAFAMSVPVVNGTYRVRLHFVELTAVKAGARRFDVRLENRTVLSGLDIVKATGGIDRAMVREFRSTVKDGKLTVEFVKRVGAAKLSAIEVIPVG